MPTTLSDGSAEALGRRWQAASGEWWQAWRPGMLWRVTHSLNEGRISAVSPGYVNFRHYMPPGDPGPWPDLRDAATRGAALEVVRERWGDHSLHLRPLAAGWGVFAMRDSLDTDAPTALFLCIAAPTEPEAIVAALEARHAL